MEAHWYMITIFSVLLVGIAFSISYTNKEKGCVLIDEIKSKTITTEKSE